MAAIVSELISEGSFGSVYKLISHSGDYALKCIPSQTVGIPNPIEPLIMCNLKHPHLMEALYVDYDYDRKQLKILQPLAKCSVKSVLKPINCRQKSIEVTTLNNWSKQLISAVSYLHSNRIVHGDIKAANILFFNNKLIKLGDFGMSAYIPNDEFIILDQSYTETHRAPEIWFQKGWTFGADIWALACTLFEMAYGYVLFPIQIGTEADIMRANIHVQQEFVKWLAGVPEDASKVSPSSTIDLSEKEFKSFIIPPTWFESKNRLLNRMLKRMFVLNPLKRPTIFEIQKEFFNISSYQIPTFNKLLDSEGDELSVLTKFIQTFNDITYTVAKSIASKLLHIHVDKQKFEAEAHFCIAVKHKLVPME